MRLACRILIAYALLCGCVPASGQAPAPGFEIRRFVVEGNTLLPVQEVDRAVSPFASPRGSFGNVQQALEALQDAYIARGYTAVRVLIPEQDIRAGEVRLEVIEAQIRNVRVEGNRFYDTPNVRAGLPMLRQGASPNTRAIGQNAQLVNENPAKQVSVSLEAADEDRKVDAVVRVADEDPSRFTVFLDNSGTGQTGYFRAGVGYQHANVANRDHVFNAQLITSPTQHDDVLIAGLGYRIPLYRWNAAFEAFAGHSDVNSGTVQNLFNVSGAGTIFGLRYIQILPRIDTYEHRVTLGWDYRAFRQDVTLVGTTGTLVPDVTIKPLSLSYSGRISQVGRDFSFYGTFAQNLPGSADGNQDAFTAQRAGANAGYSIWRYGATLSQALPQDLLVRAAFSAQTTRDLLITGEQFGMGGADSVRGYLEREVANDVGHRFSLEGYSPDFGGRIGQDWRARALVFIDVARGYDRQPVRGPENGLASAGLGMRVNSGKTLSLRADWARVLNAAGSRPEGKDRVNFAVAYSF